MKKMLTLVVCLAGCASLVFLGGCSSSDDSKADPKGGAATGATPSKDVGAPTELKTPTKTN